MVKSIYLQDGEEIFVDDEDYERVNQHTWHKSYIRNTKKVSTRIKGKIVSLESFIEKGVFQKIKGLDFTRKNLTNKGNAHRWAKARSENSSKYKGVSWSKKKNKWLALIKIDGKSKYLGLYNKEDDAARAYNQAVLDYWDGEGYLNVIGEDNRTPVRVYKTFQGQIKRRAGRSKLRGVSLSKSSSYTASIRYNKKTKRLGTFKTAEQAALAYNKVAIYLYGDEAILNDVQITDELKEFIANWEIPEKVIKLKEETENNGK